MDLSGRHGRSCSHEDRLHLAKQPAKQQSKQSSILSGFNNRFQEHSVLQVSQFTPSQFAAQMQLQLENSWAVLRAIIHECMQLSQGKYLLLKDPNNQKLILYSIPEDTFSSSEDESSDDDEGIVSS